MSILEGAQTPLGNTTKSASGPINTGVYEIEQAQWRAKREARNRVWRLRDAAGFLLGGRVCNCGKRPIPGREISIRRVDGRAYYGGVQMCGSVWTCPVCASKIARGRAAELRRGIENWVSHDGVVTMMTLTVRHDRSDNLADLLHRMSQAQRDFYSGRAYQDLKNRFGIVGSVRNLEATWGSQTGWHPHSHVLLFSHSRLDAEILFQRWAEVCDRYGLYASRAAFLEGVTCSLDYLDPTQSIPGYVTKMLGDSGEWTAAEELVYSHIKRASGRLSPMQILDEFSQTGEVRLAELFQEYAAAYRGKRHLYYSQGLRVILGLNETEVDDQELANAEGETEEILLTIPAQTWRHVVKMGLRLELLHWVEQFGVAYVQDYLLAIDLQYFNSS